MLALTGLLPEHTVGRRRTYIDIRVARGRALRGLDAAIAAGPGSWRHGPRLIKAGRPPRPIPEHPLTCSPDFHTSAARVCT